MTRVSGTENLHVLYWPDRPNSKRRPPWNWATLSDGDREAQTDLVAEWIRQYNTVYAVTDDQLIPPCWAEHAWLATELAVMTWLWWSTHCDPTCDISRTAEFYLRHLPAFRDRLITMMGRSPGECRTGHHPQSWRREADDCVNSAHHGTNPWFGGEFRRVADEYCFGF